MKEARMKIKNWQDLIGKSFLDMNEQQEGVKDIIQIFHNVPQFKGDKTEETFEFITFAPQVGISWMRIGGSEKNIVERFLDGHKIVGPAVYGMRRVDGYVDKCHKHGSVINRVGNFMRDDFPCKECRKEVNEWRAWYESISLKSKKRAKKVKSK